MYRDTTNVEPEFYDYTSNNWSHWNSNEKLKEKFGNCTRKTFDRFTTKDSYNWNITHNTESTTVWSLKPEQWGSPLVQEKYQEEKACDKRHSYRTIIITIISSVWHTGSNWSHRNSSKRFKEKFGSHARKTFTRFTTEDMHTWNITHSTESTAAWNLKPERWGSSLVRDK